MRRARLRTTMPHRFSEGVAVNQGVETHLHDGPDTRGFGLGNIMSGLLAGSASDIEQRRCELCTVRPLAVCGSVAMDRSACLAAIARGAQLAAGEPLFHEGDPAVEVFTVTSGMLKLSKLLPDGRRQVTGFLIAGDYLGLAFAERYICSAEAVTPVRLCRFARSAFLAAGSVPGAREGFARAGGDRACRGAAADAAARPQDRPRARRELCAAAGRAPGAKEGQSIDCR